MDAQSNAAQPIMQQRQLSPQPSISPQVLTELSALANPPNAENYFTFLQSAVSSHSVSDIIGLACFLYTNTLPIPPARAVYIRLAEAILTLSDAAVLQIAKSLLAAHTQSTRSFAFEALIVSIRDRLADIHEAAGDFLNAALVLHSMPFDILATLPDEKLLRCNLRIARLFTAATRPANALPYLNRASSQLTPQSDPSLRQQHRIIYADTLQAQGRFSDAAAKYHQLSHTLSTGDTLRRAVICAILAPAGPRRSRILATLFADERVRSQEVFPLLECIHMGRLLSPDQVERFRCGLGAGQDEGVLDRAVMEHNLLAASRLYADIGFEGLGTLLGVSAAKAESTAANMIKEERMKATIDQVEGVLRFAPNGRTVLIERWDAHIASLCSAVDDAVESIISKHPRFASNLEA